MPSDRRPPERPDEELLGEIDTPLRPDEFPHMTWARVEATPDDPMFRTLHVVTRPQPEESTSENDTDVPIGPDH